MIFKDHEHTLHEELTKLEGSPIPCQKEIIERYFYNFLGLYGVFGKPRNDRSKASTILRLTSEKSIEQLLEELIQGIPSKKRWHALRSEKCASHSSQIRGLSELINAEGLEYDDGILSEGGIFLGFDVAIYGYLAWLGGMLPDKLENSGFLDIVGRPFVATIVSGAAAFTLAPIIKNAYCILSINKKPDYEMMREQAKYLDRRVDSIGNEKSTLDRVLEHMDGNHREYRLIEYPIETSTLEEKKRVLVDCGFTSKASPITVVQSSLLEYKERDKVGDKGGHETSDIGSGEIVHFVFVHSERIKFRKLRKELGIPNTTDVNFYYGNLDEMTGAQQGEISPFLPNLGDIAFIAFSPSLLDAAQKNPGQYYEFAITRKSGIMVNAFFLYQSLLEALGEKMRGARDYGKA